MKSYEEAILKERTEDGSEEKSSTVKEFGSSIEEFLEYISITGLEVSKVVKSKHDEPDEIYALTYRKCYLCLGMARIFKLKKLVHLFEILEFVIDFGRTKQDFSKYSMVYLIELIFETSEKILNDFVENGACNFDLSDIVSECKTYLKEPINAFNMEIEKNSVESSDQELDEILIEAPSLEQKEEFIQDNFDAVNEVEPPENIDDGPEQLNFSEEKAALVSDFCNEVSDNLDQVEFALIELEGSEDPIALINQIFRAVHTVKGGARLLEINKIETLAHQMESLLDDIRSYKMLADEHVIDVLMDGNTAMTEMVKEVRNLDTIKTEIKSLVHQIYSIRVGEKRELSNSENNDKSATLPASKKDIVSNKTDAKKTENKISEENIRVSAGKLDEVLNTASEVFITRIRLQNDTQLLENALSRIEKITRAAKLSNVAENLRVVAEKCAELRVQLISINSDKKNNPDNALRTLNEINDILTSQIIKNLEEFPNESRLSLLRVEEIRKQLQKNVYDLEGLSGRLQTGAMGFRMVPIAQLFNRFPGQVRELSRKIGKKTKLTISGSDTELDKLLINQLTDPLIHIMRNSIDHGFENVDERKSLGKNEVGEIKLRAFYQGSNAIIEVSDDGAGIDKKKVLAQAVQNNLLSKEESGELTERAILDLVFAPGLSTAKVVTELSGRGVGMDVVKTAISGVQGAVHIESKEGYGTTVSMKLPLTLAIVGILLVSENGHQFAFPVLNVVEVLSVKRSELKKVGGSFVLNYRGTTLNVNSLSKFVGFPPSPFDEEEFSIIVLTDGNRNLGIIVNEIKGRQDVLTKQFGSLLGRIEYMMGCTILSDGSLVLIINIWEILSSKSSKQLQINSAFDSNDIRAHRSNHKVLVVDDSSMQRSRMSSILDQAGYLVETATDGHDAFEKIRTNEFAAFCVDIIMPLMDGYEFIEKLRSTEKYSDSTVLMITGKNITEGAEKRRLNALNVEKVFEKPVPEQELISALDRKCLSRNFNKGA